MATLAGPRSPLASAVLLVPALLFGLLVTLQWRTEADRSDLTLRRTAPLLDAAKSLQDEQNGLKAQLTDLRAQLDDIQRSASSQGAVARDLQGRIDELRRAAGLTERTGEGVVVLLDDTRPAAGIAPSDADRTICHSTDLTDIINAAWRGGAVAVAVNEERVVGSTSVYCIGSTSMVNGTLMSGPFSVVAIGPADRLVATFDDPTQLTDIKRRRDAHGLAFTVTRGTGLKIPAYTGAFNVRTATVR